MDIDFSQMIWIILVASGISFTITGAAIGYPIRLVAYHTLGKLRVGPIHLDSLARCPFCNAWWGAFIISQIMNLVWWESLANAFVACLIMGIAQAQWHLAADDGFEADSVTDLTTDMSNEPDK